eukprot:209560-Rhodomonas_salina.1
MAQLGDCSGGSAVSWRQEQGTTNKTRQPQTTTNNNTNSRAQTWNPALHVQSSTRALPRCDVEFHGHATHPSFPSASLWAHMLRQARRRRRAQQICIARQKSCVQAQTSSQSAACRQATAVWDMTA